MCHDCDRESKMPVQPQPYRDMGTRNGGSSGENLGGNRTPIVWSDVKRL